MWNECNLTRPWNNPRLDIVRKLSVQADWFLVGELDGSVIASALFARLLMDYGEELLKAAGCPKISLQIRTSNGSVMKFYEELGYKRDDAVSYGKRLIED